MFVFTFVIRSFVKLLISLFIMNNLLFRYSLCILYNMGLDNFKVTAELICVLSEALASCSSPNSRFNLYFFVAAYYIVEVIHTGRWQKEINKIQDKRPWRYPV